MHALVTYATRLGSTAAIAERIGARLRDQGVAATVLPVEATPDMATFDAVVIGSALYEGHWLEGARHFVRENQQELMARPAWAFSSGPVGASASRETTAPGEVLELTATIGAREHRVFAGAFDPSTVDDAKFRFIERVVAKRFVPQGDFRNWSQIDAWADHIAATLRVPSTASMHAATSGAVVQA